MSRDQSTAGALHSQRFEEALSFHQRGELVEAERRYGAILEKDGGHVEALVHLGLIRLQEGSLDGAEGLFRQALARNPNSAEAHAALANALLAQTRLDEAADGYNSALAIDPDHAEANYGLATALQGLERYEDAIPHFERAIAIDSDYAEAHYGLASTLQALNRHAQAVAFLEKALSVDPDYSEAKYGLGIALQALDREEEAVHWYESAVAVTPGFADAHNNLGVALEQLGKLDEARLAFERAVTLMPGKPGFYYNLFDSKKITAEDPYLKALQALMEDARSLPVGEQIYLHFALGKALADVGEHQRSFRHFLEGNALKRQQVAHDEGAAWRMFDRIQAVFSDELIRAKAGRGDPSNLPVFILGMPRSGSTLIEQILASHPGVFAAGERLDLRNALNSFGAASKVDLPFPERFLVATDEELRELGAAYLKGLKAAASRSPGDQQRITDKMPANYRLVGLIHLALPNARIIHTCRDPVDTCLSCFSTLFAADQPFAYDLGELGRYYRAYAQLMEHWRRVLPEGVMLDVHYEELVADFEPQARRIVAHCDLEWDEGCLSFDKAPRAVKTASSAQVRLPIYRSSIGRWRPDADVLKPLLDGLGPDLAVDRMGGRNPSD
jgi:tetratricopeptide (TPR) repeat protein